VEKWATNYKKHPAGWGALLMIQGVPEVSGRLRSKVESYAIYSALFLSVSIGVMFSPPGSVVDDQDGIWEEHIRKRLFFWPLLIGISSHMLCILLAMGFVNSLNEAPRDSDVIRMFARGQGFKATVKVQYSFRVGAITTFISMMISAQSYLGWEAVVGFLIASCVVYKYYKETVPRLFKNASIVQYWREDLGGHPDADDPYDLWLPLTCLKERAKEGKSMASRYAAAFEADMAAAAPAESKEISTAARHQAMQNAREHHMDPSFHSKGMNSLRR